MASLRVNVEAILDMRIPSLRPHLRSLLRIQCVVHCSKPPLRHHLHHMSVPRGTGPERMRRLELGIMSAMD